MPAKQEKIFFSGSTYFDALIHDFKNATTSIDIETYIFAIDKLGKKILTTLQQCAARGIKVRLLVDGAGTPQWSGHFVDDLEKSGGETRIFHPFPWRLWQQSHSFVRVPSLVKAIYLLLKINSRNHRKTCIIDDKIVYIGSYNIDVRHLAKNKAGEDWRDTGVRLENIDVTELEKAFESAWHHMPIQERIKQFFHHVKTKPIIRLNNTRHRRRILYKNLIKRMKNCQSRIWITNAYFIPDNLLLKALTNAAREDIDVRILLPRKSDILFMPWASSAFYEKLIKSGVRIFEYLPSMLHAKTLILDDWYSIGSTNLNHRSLLHDLEVDVNIRNPHSQKRIERQFLLDLENAKEVNHYRAARRFYQRAIGKLILYAKYLI